MSSIAKDVTFGEKFLERSSIYITLLFTVTLALTLQMFVFTPLLYLLFTRVNPFQLMLKIAHVNLTAFGTGSRFCYSLKLLEYVGIF